MAAARNRVLFAFLLLADVRYGTMFRMRIFRILYALLATGFLLPSYVRAIVLDPLVYPDTKSAQTAWRAIGQSPPVQLIAQHNGVVFPCRFAANVERVYWDRSLRADLSRVTSIHLELQCDDPSALRSPALYFKSGNGWYVARIPLRGTGRQTVFLSRSSFSVEGKPRGWHRIDGVRLSAWRADDRAAALVMYSLRAEADAVVIVRNTLATESAAEKKVASSVANRISRWLIDAGIPHGILTDEEVIHGGLMNARVAILSYHPHPPARELATLKVFAQRGGRLIVCYSADPELAALMNVILEPYTKAERPGQWSSFIFTNPSYWRVPEQIHQKAPNLIPAKPASSKTQVIAWWYDAYGRRSAQAAWLASDTGLWMTHVLTGEDAIAKRDMLVAFLMTLAPEVGVYAARNAVRKAGQIDSFRDFQEACAVISSIASRGKNASQVRWLLASAGKEHEHMLQSFAKNDHPEVITFANRLRRTLTEAYALAQTPRSNELRGVWDHSGTGWFPGNWQRTCSMLQDFGINAIFINALWAGLAHYPSKVVPVSPVVDQFGDQISNCLFAAEPFGIDVHLWYVCWNLENAPADFVAMLKKQGRLQKNAQGDITLWMCPTHPENRKLALDTIREAVSLYPQLRGVHLDYIRYPSSSFCFCPNCRADFERTIGRKVAHWPEDVQNGGCDHSSFLQWRSGKITSFVQQVREAVRDRNRKIKVSAAVWAGYPATVASIGQDWGGWLQQNLVDFVCPMTYTADTTQFVELTRNHLALPNAKGRIFPGIGVSAAESQLMADQVIEQIRQLRNLGASGFVLFDMSPSLRKDVLPMLRKGVTAP